MTGIEAIKRAVKTRLNMEMAAVDEMVKIALEIKPDMVTLVPEKREELTTEGGLDVIAKPDQYRKVTDILKDKGIRVSLFVDPEPSQIETAHRVGGDIIEIHTGYYSEAKDELEAEKRFKRIVKAVETAHSLDLGISAGHGLNYTNIKRFRVLPQVDEYSIGHVIVSKAIYVGFEKAVREMVDIVKEF
jgi:pyridoxine 5-phosphate synthase